MQPTMNMDTSAKTLNTQSSLKASAVEEIIYFDYHHKHKTWSSSPSSLFTTTLGESLVVNINKRSSLYGLRCIGKFEFEIEFLCNNKGKGFFEGQEDDVLDAPIPLFRRIHIVTVANDGILFCSCFSFESGGVYCEHQKKVGDVVYQHHNKEFKGFTHNDVTIRYNSAYLHLAFRSTTPKHLNAMFLHLAKNETKGPRLCLPVPDTISIVDKSPTLTALEQLKNYDASLIDIDANFFDNMHTHTFECYGAEFGDMDDFDEVFSQSIDDTNFPNGQNINARSALKTIIDSAYKDADYVGQEGIKKCRVYYCNLSVGAMKKIN